ncbi:hypothetical protein PQ676_07130 [Rickettsia felis]|nr:hypothetical protein [Rickettsia felis]MDE8611963.1 hypothetical protein [Rickettsia felis]
MKVVVSTTFQKEWLGLSFEQFVKLRDRETCNFRDKSNVRASLPD